MDLCLVLLLSSTAYDRLLRSPVSCAHLRVTLPPRTRLTKSLPFVTWECMISHGNSHRVARFRYSGTCVPGAAWTGRHAPRLSAATPAHVCRVGGCPHMRHVHVLFTML